MRILQIDNYDHCCFCNHDSTHFSILRVSANDYYSRIFDSFIFIHKSNRFFFLVKGYCVYMINKIIHGCLQIQNFSSLAQLEEKFHICARPCIILYISGTFRNPYHQIITLVSRALLGIPFIRLLPQYLSHFWDFFHSIVLLVSRALLGLSFIGCCVCISRTLSILFHWITTLVSRALLGFSFIGLLRLYLPHFQDLFHAIATLVSSAPLGFPFIRLLHQYIAQFQDSLSLDDYVGTLNNFKILFHWIATSVSRALLGFSII